MASADDSGVLFEGREPISLGEIARRALEAHKASGQPPFPIEEEDEDQ